jgi:urea transport system permease protein
MDYAVVVIVEILYAISFLLLISAGLAVIFGMMRVINLAHGEFLILGGYAAIMSNRVGVNIYIAMLIVAPLVVAIWGLIVERLIVRWLYGRLISTMLATWGLSLAMQGGFSMIFGNTQTGISAPIPGITLGNYQLNGYNLFIIAMACLIMLALYAILKTTRAGLVARAAMQRPDMAQAFGYNTSSVYMTTFVAGAALSGLAGGILAPLVGIVPAGGANYVAKAFITVIAGGASIISGTVSSAAIFGFVSQAVTFMSTSVVGEIALLVAAVVLLRLLPTGITGRYLRNRV